MKKELKKTLRLRIRFTVMLIIILVATCGTGILASAATTTTSKIGLAKAKTIALNHAKVSASNVVFKKAKIDYDRNKVKYEIEFYTSTAEYEYDIDAYRGTILEYSIERKNGSNISGTVSSSNYIGLEKAKTVALEHAGVSASNVVFKKAKIDYDRNKVKYEIEFYTNTAEYEYDIDAYSGTVLEYNIERKNGGSVSDTESNYIGLEKAKTIALEHAGVSASNVRFKKAKIDYDKNSVKYEIEFYTSWREYEYEINAVSGAIIDYEIEYRD